MRGLHAILIFLLWSLPAAAAEIHIAATGDDVSGNGSPQAPFATLACGLENAEPGDILILAQGRYQGGLSIRQPNLTITSAPNQRAIIQTSHTDEDQDTCLYVKTEASGLTLRNLEIIGGYYYAVMFESTWDRGGPEKEAAHDALIENCSIHDTGRDCIKITPAADNITIRDCEIYNSGRRDDSNAEGIDNVNGDNMRVSNCHIHDIATTGVYFKGGAQNCLVEYCLIERCGGMGISVGFDTSPEWFDTEANPLLYESIDGLVRHNIINNTTYAGIGIYASLRPRVHNNTVANAAIGGQAPLFFGVAYHDWEENVSRPPSSAPEILNNIFIQPPNSQEPILEIRFNDELEGLSALIGPARLNGNCYYNPTAPALFIDLRPGQEYEGPLPGWRDHTNNEATSMETNPLLTKNLLHTPHTPCPKAGASPQR